MYKLSPSDFAYLWQDCKHCYYQKIKYGVALPSIGIPAVFTTMNSLLQKTLVGKDLHDINNELPHGKITVAEGYLRSKPVPVASDCYISGRFDFLTEVEDGSHTVIDFKISNAKEEKVQKYTRQLQSYKFAIENPAFGSGKKVSRLGVVVISPEDIEYKDGRVTFRSSPYWYEVKEDTEDFYSFIREVSELLNGTVPPPSENCAWCKYRGIHTPEDIKEEQSDLPF